MRNTGDKKKIDALVLVYYDGLLRVAEPMFMEFLKRLSGMLDVPLCKHTHTHTHTHTRTRTHTHTHPHPPPSTVPCSHALTGDAKKTQAIPLCLIYDVIIFKE